MGQQDSALELGATADMPISAEVCYGVVKGIN